MVEPQNEVTHEVPDQTIRNWFLVESRSHADVRRLVDRLLGFGVEVHRLDEGLVLGQARRPGIEEHDATIPAGSWWIPMAQPQKRWVQALLGEDPYVPFDYFYDVSSWSNPQLMNVDAVWTAEAVTPAATRVLQAPGIELAGDLETATALWFAGTSGQDVAVASAIAASDLDVEVHRLTLPTRVDGRDVPAGAFVVRGPDGSEPVGRFEDVVALAAAELGHLDVVLHASDVPLPGDARPFFGPRVALFEPATAAVTLVSEPFGHLAWTLEQHWRLDVDRVTAAQVAAGQLAAGGYDVFVVGGSATAELDPLAPVVQDFVSQGGTYVGLARGGTGGTAWAVANGWTSSDFTRASGTAGGTTFRIEVDTTAGPLALGADEVGFWFNLPDFVLAPTSTGRTVARYPSADEMFFSGYAAGESAWAESAVLVEEELGAGRVVLFSGDPAFRGLTEGPAFLLANAIASPAFPMDGLLRDLDGDPLGPDEAPRLDPSLGWGRPLTIEVDAADADATARLLADFATDVLVEPTDRGTVRLLVANPFGLDVEAHPFTWKLRPALDRAGIRPVVALL